MLTVCLGAFFDPEQPLVWIPIPQRRGVSVGHQRPEHECPEHGGDHRDDRSVTSCIPRDHGENDRRRHRREHQQDQAATRSDHGHEHEPGNERPGDPGRDVEAVERTDPTPGVRIVADVQAHADREGNSHQHGGRQDRERAREQHELEIAIDQGNKVAEAVTDPVRLGEKLQRRGGRDRDTDLDDDENPKMADAPRQQRRGDEAAERDAAEDCRQHDRERIRVALEVQHQHPEPHHLERDRHETGHDEHAQHRALHSIS